MHRTVVGARAKRPQLDAGRDSDRDRGRLGEIDRHPPVVVRRAVAVVREQVGGRAVGGDDVLPQRQALLARPPFDDRQQRAADPPPEMLGMHVDILRVGRTQRVRRQAASRRLDQERVRGQVDLGVAPLVADVVEREVGLADVRDVAGRDHREHRLGIGLRRRAGLGQYRSMYWSSSQRCTCSL